MRTLGTAQSHGIELIDTAVRYGNIESRLARMVTSGGCRFRLISKTADCIPHSLHQASALLPLSASNGGNRPLKEMLIHHFSSFLENPSQYARLQRWRDCGLVEQVGFFTLPTRTACAPVQLCVVFPEIVPGKSTSRD